MDARPEKQTNGAAANPAGGAAFRILVADDEASLRNAMARSLEALGHEVVSAADGLEAWMRFHEAPFPIVVADIRMPGLTGIELLERIRNEKPDTEVVLVSGFGDTGVVIEALRHGATNFVEKPFSESEFLRQMEPAFQRCGLALEKARLQQELSKLREREERERRMAALGRLLSGLAHEIHNPLTFIKGNAELLERFCQETRKGLSEGALPNEVAVAEMLGLVKDLRHGIERIESMVESVRLFGGRPLSFCREAKLSEIMRLSFREALSKKPIGVAADLVPPPDSFLVEVNETEMESCFVNLLVNAFEAAACGGGSVRFYTREIPYDTDEFFGFVEIVVEDDGPGIPQAIVDEVFTPFFTTKPGGTGLGLSVAYEAAKRNGAQVEIDSEEGKGTTVTVRLPFRLAKEARDVRKTEQKSRVLPAAPSRGAAGRSIRPTKRAHKKGSSPRHSPKE
ncbi:sensor histidine kinase [Deferrisoma camini]|uniref:sensor histidine kinase n=1 Tax=Deferrisoma camini TaxID=1035120 RepID=UPI00046D95A9|nr:hybrid sensor histidine kinase/response regulator [Deferrisoma camini]